MGRTKVLWPVLVVATLAVAQFGSVPSAGAEPGTPGSAPVLNLSDGQTLGGTVKVNAEPVTEGDPIVSLTVDGQAVAAKKNAGTAHLSFDMGGNGTEARYHNYVVVNEHTAEAERLYLPNIAGGVRGTVDFPGDWLHSGVNTLTAYAGANWVDTTSTTAVGVETLPYGEGMRCPNYDDFALSSMGLGLLGVVADGEANAFSYSFGDGTCGTSKKLLSQPMTFVVSGEVGGTAGLGADLDTTKLTNGEHTIAAVTNSGATSAVRVRVNNDPAGAARISPADGVRVKGTQRIVAASPTGASEPVSALAVDGQAAENDEVLAAGVATLGFTVEAGNSVEGRYHNYVLVNGNRVDLGGDHAVSGAEPVSLPVPTRFLRNGDNVVQVRTGDYNGTLNGATCANHDDFKVTRSSAALTLGIAGTVTAGPAYVVTTTGGTETKAETTADSIALGDGTCGPVKDLELHFAVVGAPTTRTVETLGSGGDAHLKVFIGGNGTDGGYDNRVLINGIPVEMGIWEKETADLAFPNEWLVPGMNVVQVLAGSDHGSAKPGGCDNYDDFTMRDFQLTPVGAKARQVTRQTAGTTVTVGSATYPAGSPLTAYFGDGSCGSSFNATKDLAYLFYVTNEDGSVPTALGRRADLDTAKVADGQHTITAVAGGKTSTRHITVDNTAPEVAESVPAPGQRLTSTVALTVRVKDASGVAGTPAITLDGKAVKEGDEIGHGLPAGDHTIAVVVADTLGNTAVREIHFSSASIPDVPTSLTSDVDPSATSATLSALIPGDDGTPLTATFTKADVVLPTTGYQGVAAAVPTTLDVAHDGSVELDSLRPLDGQTVDSPSGRDVVFQRYDLTVGGTTQPTLRWEGTIDPARVVALRVWDPAASRWTALTSARGKEQGNTVLTAALPEELRDGTTVHVLVTGEDPFADDLSPRDETAQNDKDRFEDPSTYDFALAHFTDTQYITEGAAGGTYNDFDGVSEPSDVETAEEQAVWQAAYRMETQWIADNAHDRKIAYAAHTGDVIENDYYDPLARKPDGSLLRPGLDEQVEKELAVSSGNQKVLDDSGLVNQVIAGNHDNQLGAETGPTSRFSRTFSAPRYYGASKAWPAGASYHAWDETTNPDGTVTPGQDNQNNYVLFSAGGLDFVAVGLSYGVTRPEAQWADSIFKKFKDRNGILLSHDYLKPSTNKDGRGAAFSDPDGSALYQQVVSDNANVFLVLAGHEHGVGTNLKTGIGVTKTHDVVELLADYQFYTVATGELWPDKVDANGNIDVDGDGKIDHKATDRLQFGASFLRLLQFDVDRSELHIDTYSPYLKNFGATEYDIRQDGSQNTPRYNGSEDNLTLPVDLTTRKTSFRTDSLAAYVPGGVIGTDSLVAGEKASTTWPGLQPATAYAWIVSARSSDDGVSIAQPAVFRTPKGKPTVTATTATTDWGTAARVTVKVSGNATGTVEVREGSKVLASSALTGGSATLAMPAGLAGGTHDLTVAYSGSSLYEPAVATVKLVVNLPAQWSATKVYGAGDKVVFEGKVFLASYYAKGTKPGDPNGAWQELALTEAGDIIWTPSRIFQGGEIVTHQGKTFKALWYTRNQEPGKPNGPWSEIAPGNPGDWTPSTIYLAGDQVKFQGHVYEAKWWTRNQAPPGGPWKLIR